MANCPLLCIRQWKRKALVGIGVLEKEGLLTLTLEKEHHLRPMEPVKKSVQKKASIGSLYLSEKVQLW